MRLQLDQPTPKQDTFAFAHSRECNGEQLGRTRHVDDRSAPVAGTPSALAHEERLVQPQRGDRPDAVGSVDEWGAVGEDGVHHGVPVTAELAGHLGDGTSVAAGAVGDLRTHHGDSGVGLGPRAHLVVGLGATPATLVPLAGPFFLGLGGRAG